MKKNLLKVLAVAAFAAIAGYNVSQSNNETEGMSDTMLANVEALANEEWYDGNCFWIDWNYTWCKEYGIVPLGCPCGAFGLDN